MKLIVAMDEKGGIGKNGSIPWNYPEDLKYFQKMTLNQNVIMGRKTFEDIYKKLGTTLPDRKNIVLTKTISQSYWSELREPYKNLVIVPSVFEVTHYLNLNVNKTWIIGGAEIYKAFMPYITEAYITRIEGDYNCNVFMPKIPSNVEIIENFIYK